MHWGPVDADDLPHRKPDGHLMLDSVRSILSSGRPDDAISGELAELLGFDELELVSNILSNRSQFFEEPRIINGPAPTPLPSKGKGKDTGNSPSVVIEAPTHDTVQIRGASHLIKSGGVWKNNCKQTLPDHCSPVLQSVASFRHTVLHLVLN